MQSRIPILPSCGETCEREFLDDLRSWQEPKASCGGECLSASSGRYAERIIGTIKRERLDHMAILNERHLLRTMKDFQIFYNGSHTHLSFSKNSPHGRSPSTFSILLFQSQILVDCITLTPRPKLSYRDWLAEARAYGVFGRDNKQQGRI